MPHSSRVILVFVIALALSAICAYILLSADWFLALLPIIIDPTVSRFTYFAIFFLVIFDLMIVAIEEVKK